MRLKNISRRSLLTARAALAAPIAACGESDSRVFVSVHVLENGTYKVNGKLVVGEKLEVELTSYKPKLGRLDIGFQLASTAKYEYVQYAMSIAQKLEASVGIVGNETFQ